MEDRTTGVDAECSKSIQGDCIPSQFSKPYLMYSATDVAFAIVDFAKGNVEDDVVNSPPSPGTGRSPFVHRPHCKDVIGPLLGSVHAH